MRLPAVAGRFYPDDAAACTREAKSYLKADPVGAGVPWIGGIVPHAGWICSGAIAGRTIATLSQSVASPDVVVVFGAIHTPLITTRGELDPHASWSEPTGETSIAEAVQAQLATDSNFEVDQRFHENEHAIEVELPLIQLAWPNARLVPIEVPPVDSSIAIGEAVARVVQKEKLQAIYLASSDLTHYGPSYRFTPAGIGLQALEWAKQNDRRLLDAVQQMRVEQIVPEARSRFNACGPGAIAAMLAACRAHGAKTTKLLQHANSYETLQGVVGFRQRPDDAVGYAGVVVS
jgi:AmmeMemoRadiSam system protein B